MRSFETADRADLSDVQEWPALGSRGTLARKISASPFRWPDNRSLPRRPWVWGRWLLRGTVSTIVAPGGVGKSSFVASMLLSLTSGRQSVLGKTVWLGPQRAWYWNLEDNKDELEMQVTAAAMYHGVTEADCEGRMFLDSGPGGPGGEGAAPLCIATNARDGGRIISPVVDELIAELIFRRMDVLVVDPFVSSHAVEENDNGAIDAVVKEWGRVAQRANCSIVLVHHTKKLGGDKATAEAARGAGSLIAAARVALVLNTMDKDEGLRFGIIDEHERKRFFTVQDGKANRAPAETAQWFHLASQDVDNSTGPDDPYGQEGDSVGVVTRWTPPDPFDGISLNDLRAVQSAVGGGVWMKNHQAKDWVGIAIASALDLDVNKNIDRKRIQRLLAEWLKNGVLAEEARVDTAKGRERLYIVVGRLADDHSPPTPPSVGSKWGSGESSPHPTPPIKGGGGGGDAGRASDQLVLAPRERGDDVEL